MFHIGLTGGIGSGKTTVSARLVELGHTVIDADAITHELQQPGQPTLAAMVDAFGPGILRPDGTLDRPEMARIAFGDGAALARLNAIVHPAVGAEIAARLSAAAEAVPFVILDVPLLVESGRNDLSELVVVDVDPELAVARLVAQRGFDEADARRRIAHQVPRTQRLASATYVIDNAGTREELDTQITALHDHLVATYGPVSQR